MESWDGVGVLAMVLLVVILAVLLLQYWRLGKLGEAVQQWHASTQERQRRIGQHAELQAALRAEKAHVEQLMRKVEILQAMLPGQ